MMDAVTDGRSLLPEDAEGWVLGPGTGSGPGAGPGAGFPSGRREFPSGCTTLIPGDLVDLRLFLPVSSSFCLSISADNEASESPPVETSEKSNQPLSLVKGYGVVHIHGFRMLWQVKTVFRF